MPGGEVRHDPVMLAECLDHLALRPGATVVDATLGLGGHSAAMLDRIGQAGHLIGLDRDPEAIRIASERLDARCRERGWDACPLRTVHTDYSRLGTALDELGLEAADAFLFDLGVSSMQLDLSERGFSFREEGPLDMRMDPSGDITAADLVNELPERDLADIIWRLGEDRHARRIARRIVEARKEAPLRTTRDLEQLVWGAYSAPDRRGRLHPATRTFQALRIEVNDELASIEPALLEAASRLAPGGRIVVLAYHSLEDRIVKRTFEFLAGRCRCAPEQPACNCGAREVVRILTRKPLSPTEEEIIRNPRARSARMRAVERLAIDTTVTSA